MREVLCICYVSPWLSAPEGKQLLQMMYPYKTWHMKSSCLDVLKAKFIVCLLVLSILLKRYFGVPLNLCSLSEMFKRKPLSLQKVPMSYLMLSPTKRFCKRTLCMCCIFPSWTRTRSLCSILSIMSIVFSWRKCFPDIFLQDEQRQGIYIFFCYTCHFFNLVARSLCLW